MMKTLRTLAGVSAIVLLMAHTASAGPFIFAGTDSDDHGFASGGANQDGWLFMQKALENLALSVTNGNKVVSILGSTSTASTAANSAFSLSSLVADGWTVENIAIADFATFFAGDISNSGILMMDSGFNVSGGVDGSAYSPYAADINTFLGGGGGLLSQSNGYQWVNVLLPGLTVVNSSDSTPLALTAAGSAAFPGLTNADLSAGPWHSYFDNFAPIPLLATAFSGGADRALIIGASAGTITDPEPPTVPEPATITLFGLAASGFALRRRRAGAR